MLNDGGRHAVIGDGVIKSYIVQDKKYTSGFRKDATEVLEGYLKSHGKKSTGHFGFNKKLRYFEGVLEPGEAVALSGKGTWKRAEEAGLPEQYYEVLVITANDNGKIYLSDDPDTVKRETVV